ncbi:hypothetical protein amyaer_0379 [Microcystis aeruginosa NIES-2481]|nr:hypothetical protein amyaer_0379 [Microcystis aeruginosa NIES-2481]
MKISKTPHPTPHTPHPTPHEKLFQQTRINGCGGLCPP